MCESEPRPAVTDECVTARAICIYFLRSRAQTARTVDLGHLYDIIIAVISYRIAIVAKNPPTRAFQRIRAIKIIEIIY